MHRFFVPALAIAILALTASPVMAQGNSKKQATAPSPTMKQLTLEFDALNSMTDSMGKFMTKTEPFFFNKNLKTHQGPVIGIQEEHGQGS